MMVSKWKYTAAGSKDTRVLFEPAAGALLASHCAVNSQLHADCNPYLFGRALYVTRN